VVNGPTHNGPPFMKAETIVHIHSHCNTLIAMADLFTKVCTAVMAGGEGMRGVTLLSRSSGSGLPGAIAYSDRFNSFCSFLRPT